MVILNLDPCWAGTGVAQWVGEAQMAAAPIVIATSVGAWEPNNKMVDAVWTMENSQHSFPHFTNCMIRLCKTAVENGHWRQTLNFINVKSKTKGTWLYL